MPQCTAYTKDSNYTKRCMRPGYEYRSGCFCCYHKGEEKGVTPRDKEYDAIRCRCHVEDEGRRCLKESLTTSPGRCKWHQNEFQFPFRYPALAIDEVTAKPGKLKQEPLCAPNRSSKDHDAYMSRKARKKIPLGKSLLKKPSRFKKVERSTENATCPRSASDKDTDSDEASDTDDLAAELGNMALEQPQH